MWVSSLFTVDNQFLLLYFSIYQQRAAAYLIISYGSEKRKTKNGAADFLQDPSWTIVLDSSHFCFAVTIPEASQANNCAFNSSLVNIKSCREFEIGGQISFPINPMPPAPHPKTQTHTQRWVSGETPSVLSGTLLQGNCQGGTDILKSMNAEGGDLRRTTASTWSCIYAVVEKSFWTPRAFVIYCFALRLRLKTHTTFRVQELQGFSFPILPYPQFTTNSFSFVCGPPMQPHKLWVCDNDFSQPCLPSHMFYYSTRILLLSPANTGNETCAPRPPPAASLPVKQLFGTVVTV